MAAFWTYAQETATLLKFGEASFEALTTSKRLETHRDVICSAALHVAIELLARLPLDEVEARILTNLLDAATGDIDPDAAIPSRFMPPQNRTFVQVSFFVITRIVVPRPRSTIQRSPVSLLF